MKTIFLFGFITLQAIASVAQITLTNDKPKPGERVSFAYTPPSSFTAKDTVECVVYYFSLADDEIGPILMKNYKQRAIALKKEAGKYVGSIDTDTTWRALSFNFSANNVKYKIENGKPTLVSGKVDDRDSLGYVFPLYGNNQKPAKLAYFMAGFQYIFKNPYKALYFFDKEIQAHPYEQKHWLPAYNFALRATGKKERLRTDATDMINKIMTDKPSTEREYDALFESFNVLGLGSMAKYFRDMADEKYKNGNGKVAVNAIFKEYEEAKGNEQKIALMQKEIKQFKQLSYPQQVDYTNRPQVPMWMKINFLYAFLKKPCDVEAFANYSQKLNMDVKSIGWIPDWLLMNSLNSLADSCGNKELARKRAAEFMDFYTKQYAGKDKSPLPYQDYFSPRGWKKQCASNLYSLNQFLGEAAYASADYKTAFTYAKQAKTLYDGMGVMDNITPSQCNEFYCKMAEKMVPANTLKTEMEKMVSAGHYTPAMVEILKRLYNDDSNFDQYINSFKKNYIGKVQDDTKKYAVQETKLAPDFSLPDADGKMTTLSALKGKTVVLDFWATWCGPCKASFPAMKDLVEKYKDKSDVVFLFIDTWEKFKSREENVEKVKAFMTKNNYPFQIVYDLDSKVVANYGVSGIPAKFIIDKAGNLRYSIKGGETDKVKLLDEMDAMIESAQ